MNKATADRIKKLIAALNAIVQLREPHSEPYREKFAFLSKYPNDHKMSDTMAGIAAEALGDDLAQPATKESP